MKKYILIGNPNTGKTTITTMIERYLRSIGFRNYCRRYEISENDSAIVLEGANINGKTIRILLNTPSDTIGIIDEVYDYYQQNSSVDFVITTVRDMYEERNYLFETFFGVFCFDFFCSSAHRASGRICAPCFQNLP